MKKLLLVCSMTGLLAISLVCLFFVDGRGISCQVLSAKKAQRIEAEMTLTAQEADFELVFAGETLPYDSGSRTFFLPLGMDSAIWESGEITASDNRDIFFLEDFTKEEKQTLIAENRAIPFWAVTAAGYGAYFLKFTGLPVMSFEGTEQRTDEGESLYAFRLYEADSKTDWVTKCYTTSQLRGNTSLAYEKKSLRLRLKKQGEDGAFEKKNANLLGLREDDDWILNSLYADSSRIRDKLCMDLWQRSGANNNPYGVSFGTAGEYVEVFINDNYTGLYLLTYPIDRKQLGMDSVSTQLSVGETVVERLYKKKYTALWQESDFTGELPDANQPDFRGGFYVKGDTVLGDTSEWEPLRQVAACMEADSETFCSKIGTVVDIGNVVDNWLFFQAIGGFDNENKNVYYVARNRENEYYGYFIPWDMNLSFGAVYADNSFYCEETLEEVQTPVLFEPGQRVVEENASGAQALVRATWLAWREGAFATEQVLAQMDALQSVLTQSGALHREMERWPDGNAGDDLSLLKAFAKQRLEFVDEYVGALTE